MGSCSLPTPNGVHNGLRAAIREAATPIQKVILSLEASPDIDLTSVDMLDQVRDELKASAFT